MRQRNCALFKPFGSPLIVTFLVLFATSAHASITFVGASSLADTGSPVSSLAVGVPAGVQAGDCLLAQVVVYDGNGTNMPSMPSGWSAIRHDSISAGYKMTSWLYYRIAGSNEPASYSWKMGSTYAAAEMGAYRGTLASPIDRSSGAIAGGGSPITDMAPSLTPSTNGELQAFFYGAQGDRTPNLTLPITLTQRSDATSSHEGFALAFGDVAAPSAGRASSTYPVVARAAGAMTAQAVLLMPSNGSGSTPTAVATATPVPTATQTPSQVVKLASPASASNLSGTVQIVSQIAPSVNSINLYVDSNMLMQGAPLTYNWNTANTANGGHILSVQAYNSSNVMLGTNAINVTVSNNVVRTPTPTVRATVTPTPTATPTTIADPLRPTNNIPNNRVPTAAELSTFHNGQGACGGLDTCTYMQQVTGNFVGTTSQIIQQVADKWCPNCTILNPLDGQTYTFADLLRAVAVNETNWYQWRAASLSSPDPVTGLTTLTPSHGDLEHVTQAEPDGGSWGLFQIAEGVNQGWPSSFPLSAVSTGFNADFKVAEQMGVEQGHLDYLSDASRAQIAIANGFAPYTNYRDSNGVMHLASTDVNVLRWGAVGNWYSGGWYDSGAIGYIQQAQQHLHAQPWKQASF